jgi:hypothetical protein
MLTVYQQLLRLYPAEHRRQFGDEMLAVLSEKQFETVDNRLIERAVICIRETSGLLTGALRENLRTLTGTQKWLAFPTRRFNVRNEFRFPKATAVLMMIILAGIVLALEKARVIQESFSNGNPPVVPMEAAHLTFFPTLALLLVIFYAAGLVGWAILFAFRRSGVHRLAQISGEQK